MLASEKSSSLSSFPKRRTRLRRSKPRTLSPAERAQVSLATFREGYNHRLWPREVIEQFLAVPA